MCNLSISYNNSDISINIYDLEEISDKNVMTNDSVTTYQKIFTRYIFSNDVVALSSSISLLLYK